jgi:radical SAM-linked protein
VAAEAPDVRYLASFRKTGLMVFLGHLEMMEVFKRAFRRANLKLALSQGFHPSPKLSFLSALPLGVESYDERLLFSLLDDLSPEGIINDLVFPEGIEILTLEKRGKELPKVRIKAAEWRISSRENPVFTASPLFPEALLSYTDKKGKERRFTLKDYVYDLVVQSPHELFLSLYASPEGSPKPLLAARALWGLSPELPLELCKTKTVIE